MGLVQPGTEAVCEFSTYKHTKSPSAVRVERELVVDREASFSPHQQKY